MKHQIPRQTATPQLFEDLATFAALEVASQDLEPWALLIRALRESLALPDEHTLWLIKLYNAYDAFSSAWQVYRRWQTPPHWARSGNRADVAQYACTQERRNLRGGKICWHFDSYLAQLGGYTQRQWLTFAPCDFLSLMQWVRSVWGVGRQSAFEWVEFLAKAAGFPVEAPNAQLWESEGPRRSLQSLFGNDHPTPGQLEDYAHSAKDFLAGRGVVLTWEDFETVICDFHVMRLGRYYPGRHLAALRGELDEIPDAGDRALLLQQFQAMIPAPWNRIGPGIDKALLPVYFRTGTIVRVDEELAA